MQDGVGTHWPTPDEATRITPPTSAPTGPAIIIDDPPPIAAAAIVSPPPESGDKRSPLVPIVAVLAVLAVVLFATTQFLGGDDEDERPDAEPPTSPVAAEVDGSLTAVEVDIQAADAAIVGAIVTAVESPAAQLEEAVAPPVSVDFTGISEEDAFIACYSLDDALGFSACLRDGIAAGVIAEGMLLPENEFPECGGVELKSFLSFELDGRRTNLSQLTDDEYTTLVAEAAVCFQAKVDEGLVEDYEIPPDFQRLECAGGINPFARDEVVVEQFLDCIYELS